MMGNSTRVANVKTFGYILNVFSPIFRIVEVAALLLLRFFINDFGQTNIRYKGFTGLCRIGDNHWISASYCIIVMPIVNTLVIGKDRMQMIKSDDFVETLIQS